MSYAKTTCFTLHEMTTKRKKFESKRRLDGKVVVITGANTGIGKETAYQLSLKGAKVITGCRNVEKAESAISDIKEKNSNADILVLKLDLSSLNSVRQFAENVSEQVSTIDILINNAGVMMTPEWKTEDGFEMQFGTNHLGHFLLTMHLLPLLRKSSNARIVTVASSGHLIGKIHLDNINLNGAYTPMKAYSQSKLANVLFTRELAKRLAKSNIKAYCLHPGAVATDLQRHSVTSSIGNAMVKRMLLTPEMGAQTTLYCALDESLDNESGFFYANCGRYENMISTAVDDVVSEKLWDLSCDLVNLEDHLRIPSATSHAWQKEID